MKITGEQLGKIKEILGGDIFYFIVVIKDGEDTCDVVASARNPQDIKNARVFIEKLFPPPRLNVKKPENN